MTEQIDINLLLDFVRKAGEAILQIYNHAFDVTHKDDSSPLTLADTASNQILIDSLTKAYPNIPFISEETKQTAWAERQYWRYCWLIDPLDGTKEFVKRNGEFTINIALIHEQTPVLGLVYVPVQDLAYYAIKGKGSYKVESGKAAVRIHARPIEPGKPVITFASRSHRNQETNDFIQRLEEKYGRVEVTGAGSALKFCMVAEGKAHVYPRFSPCMEWDTAAGHIVAAEAGAMVTQPNGSPLVYNKENLLSPNFVVSV
ncbi:3'(2'),5'-bisphosphate nucleotidase [Sphingobacteriales bacterium UPWRP_1]|nr:3'(2'),5'-bisphosphate nucleotidase [Sphingobacteriales bacterium TSM_CSS]PSJ78770.1 3'(2'),5'-bisphosphate nucleotidase [Sphingobacteriales bacterium UPWRP_1]